MEPKKRKKNHVVIVTSDAADAAVKRFQIRTWLLWLIIIVLCVAMGAGLGYILYEDQIRNAANTKIQLHEEKVKSLEAQLEEQRINAEEQEKAQEKEIVLLNERIDLYETTVNLQKEEIQEMTEIQQEMYQPTTLPLTGAATIEEVGGEEPACLFTAAEGALIVATASGSVTEVVEVPDEGYRVSIDHGNGYVTVYQNAEEPKLKQGDDVMRGMTVFVVERTSLKLGYQIIKDGVYVNPMDIMEIDG